MNSSTFKYSDINKLIKHIYSLSHSSVIHQPFIPSFLPSFLPSSSSSSLPSFIHSLSTNIPFIDHLIKRPKKTKQHYPTFVLFIYNIHPVNMVTWTVIINDKLKQMELIKVWLIMIKIRHGDVRIKAWFLTSFKSR